MKCPLCKLSKERGYARVKRGRPKKVDDPSVKRLRNKYGWSLAKIALEFGVTRGAIQASLKRSARK